MPKTAMKAFRIIKRLPVTATKRVLITPTTHKMSFFSRPPISEYPSSFTPLFRLLDDFDTYSQETGNKGGQHHRRSRTRIFNPKFDIKELPEAYELYGELPGIEQKDVEIEFTDPQTLIVRGRTERSYRSSTPPSHLAEGQKTGDAITEGGERPQQSHKATVEDESDSQAKESDAQVASPDQKEQRQSEKLAKYWVSERSVGEFARSFSFPSRVDQDVVKASMKNGVLTIVVPKAKKHESHKIAITSS